jgi:hypothetical protein
VSNRFILVFLADNWGNPIGEARVNTRTGKMTIEISNPDVVEALVNTDRYLLGLTIEEVKRRRPDAGGKRPGRGPAPGTAGAQAGSTPRRRDGGVRVSTMDDLAAWLEQIWAEDERAARSLAAAAHSHHRHIIRHARIAADREILAKWRREMSIKGDGGSNAGLEHALRCIALPYADRPGYQEAWRPA